MDSSNGCKRKVKMFFFPYIAGGHLLPMIDTARFFASHPDVQVGIIATPKNVQLFQDAIDRDRESGHDIDFHAIELPTNELGLAAGVENFLGSASKELRMKLMMATIKLREPLRDILGACRPDCLISDFMHPWTLDVANEVGIPRIGFNVFSLFNSCAEDCIRRFKPHENVGTDTEPFVLTGLSDEVKFTKSRIPNWHRDQNEVALSHFKAFQQAEESSFGVMYNSFYDLESKYVEYTKNVMGRRVWMVGPVSQYASSRSMGGGIGNNDKDEDVVKWLDSHIGVLYVSFGSEAYMCKEQFHEIAHGLEASGRPFIWVARTNIYEDQGDEGWFPQGFEERMKELNRGLIIKGWAPQLLILAHPSVGAFMTHCGWNSTIEGLSKGVPMITWPLGVDQFYSESVIVDVAKVGIRVGNEEWMSLMEQPKVTVTRGKVESAVTQIMGDGEEVVEMRRRVKHYAEMAKLAVQGGSSYQDVYALVEELKARQNITLTTA